MKNKAKKRYSLQMLLVFTIYLMLLFLVNALDAHFELEQWQRIGLAVLPVLPALAMIFVVFKFVRSMDEVLQKIITEAALISAAIIGIATFTLGFLEGVIPLPQGLLIWIWPAMMGLHAIITWFVRLRYQ